MSDLYLRSGLFQRFSYDKEGPTAERLKSGERTDGTTLVTGCWYLENPGYTHNSSMSD